MLPPFPLERAGEGAVGGPVSELLLQLGRCDGLVEVVGRPLVAVLLVQ